MNKRIILLCAGIASAATVFGAGFQLYTEGSAEALGQAGAVSGRTNLISQAWYTPAALAGADRAAIMAGSTFVRIETDFDSDLGSGFDSKMADDWRMIPHFYGVLPVNENVTGLLSVNAPYGLITEWTDNWIGNMAATYSELKTIYVTPSVAAKVTEDLSLSAGFNVVSAEADLQAFRGALGMRKLEGDDIGYGYTASAHWQMADEWGLGARYQSRVKFKLEGETQFSNLPGAKFDTAANLELPSTVNIGVANSSIDRLHLGLDVVWTEWSTYDQLVYNFGAGYPTPPLPNPETTPKNWKDVWSIRAGGEYELNESWVVRGGYVWDESPVDDQSRAPELPGSSRHMLMTGLGWKGEQLGVDLAYSFLWAEDATTGANVVAATGGATAGSYSTETHLIALSLSYEF